MVRAWAPDPGCGSRWSPAQDRHAVGDERDLVRFVIHSAGIQDRDGAALVFERIEPRFLWLDCVFADTDYKAQQTYEAAGANALRLEIVRRNPNAVGFEVTK